MKPIKNLNIALICVMLLFLGNCQKCKKEVCPTPTSAKFKMYQPLDYSEYNADTKVYTPKKYIVDEDVFFMESTITFEAEDSMALSYEWKIGDDDRVFTTKKFSLRFKENDLGAVRQLDIRLIIKKMPASCNAGDNGIDTLVRKVNFINGRTELEKWAMYGKYFGYNEDEPDKKFIIEIKREIRPSAVYEDIYGIGLNYVVNLLPNCLSNGDAVYITLGGNNSAATFGGVESPLYLLGAYTCACDGQRQLAYLSSDKQQITVLYGLFNIDRTTGKYSPRINKKFIGARIL